MKLVKGKLCILLLSILLSVSAMGSELDIQFGPQFDYDLNIRLANQGSPTAQYILGVMYSQGQGVGQNYHKAFEWYQKAANQGVAEAQYNLGVMYLQGQGVRQDYYKAFEWYQKAANQEFAMAQYNLGVMYSKGHSVRQDYRQAKEWYGMACDNGLQEGCDAYKDLNQRGF